MERLEGVLFFRTGNEMRRKEKGVGVYIEGLGKVKGLVK